MNTKMKSLLALLLALLVMAPALAEPVAETDAAPAEPYVELSTPYPAMTVNAGDEMTLDLAIDNYSGQSQDFALGILEMPEGWTGDFSASGQRVSTVHARDGEVVESVAFELTVPLEAEAGDYAIILEAAGEGYSDELTIDITVSAEELGNSSFEVEYPEQEGDAQTDFTFSATLINNTLTSQSYALSASAPAGWTVNFTPSGETTRVAALELDARTTQGVSINVVPPENVAAGTYEIPCTATTVSERLSFTLSVTINGTYDLMLSTPSGLLSFDAYSNKESAVQLTLTNFGNTDLVNVNLTSSAPSGWTVRFATETIEVIEAGATVETTAYITPGENAMSGDYLTTITAADSNTSDSAEFRVTVKTETTWGVVGIAAIVVLALVLFAVMRKFGRR